MPTFDDPRKDAAEAYEALRGLAHASRAFTDPADTYTVIGDLLGGVRSLRQVLDQLATTHTANRARAYDDAGSQAAGATAALSAADELHQAGTLLDQVEARLDAASQHSGRIAWHPAETSETPVRRWISVALLDGAHADKVLDLIHAAGTDAAIEHLAGYDYGEDTVRDALANGYVYDNPPRGALDRMATKDVYTLTYSPFLGHVSLLREYDAVPDPAVLGIDTAQSLARSVARAPARAARVEATDWFARAPHTTSPGQGLSL